MSGITYDFKTFQCVRCQSCCRQEGYVRLEHNEPDQIAKFLSMDVRDFIDQYTMLTKDRHSLSLIERKDSGCIFMTDSGCRINGAKPAQCRDFPLKWRFKKWETICGWAISHQL